MLWKIFRSGRHSHNRYLHCKDEQDLWLVQVRELGFGRLKWNKTRKNQTERLTINSVKLKTGWNYSTIKRLTKTDYSKYLYIVKQVYWRSLKCQVVGKRHTHESTAKTPAFNNYITTFSASESTTVCWHRVECMRKLRLHFLRQD